jgi:hypothetical protein
MWDDGLLQAWKEDQRLTLLVRVEEYLSRRGRSRYWLIFHQNCTSPTHVANADKPPVDEILNITRSKGTGFYLSGPLLNQLKLYPRSYALRTVYGLNWVLADSIGMDEPKSQEIFQGGNIPEKTDEHGPNDPITQGFVR